MMMFKAGNGAGHQGRLLQSFVSIPIDDEIVMIPCQKIPV